MRLILHHAQVHNALENLLRTIEEHRAQPGGISAFCDMMGIFKNTEETTMLELPARKVVAANQMAEARMNKRAADAMKNNTEAHYLKFLEDNSGQLKNQHVGYEKDHKKMTQDELANATVHWQMKAALGSESSREAVSTRG